MSYTDAPTRLKAELDDVLKLQEDVEIIENGIETTQKAIRQLRGHPTTFQVLKDLKDTQQTLTKQVEDLYASLNVGDRFAELRGLDREDYFCRSSSSPSLNSTYKMY